MHIYIVSHDSYPDRLVLYQYCSAIVIARYHSILIQLTLTIKTIIIAVLFYLRFVFDTDC